MLNAANSSPNYTIIIILTIIISLPFIVSSIAIPIFNAIAKHKKKHSKSSKTKLSKSIKKK